MPLSSLVRRTLVAAFLLGLVADAASAADASSAPSDGWTKVDDEGGITAWAKSLDGVATVSMRAESVVPATVQDIFEVMADNVAAPEWMPLIVERRNLGAVSETERIEYTHVGMPWPIKDRYFVNRARAEWLDGGVLRLSAQSVEKTDFVDADKIRGTLHYSEFLLTPLDGGRRTRITLEVNTDPNGLIPKWIVNRAQRGWPRKFFTGLVSQLGKRGKLLPAEAAPIAH